MKAVKLILHDMTSGGEAGAIGDDVGSDDGVCFFYLAPLLITTDGEIHRMTLGRMKVAKRAPYQGTSLSTKRPTIGDVLTPSMPTRPKSPMATLGLR